MRKIKLLIVLFAIICTLSVTYAFYSTKTNTNNIFKTEGYTFKIDATGGKFTENNVVVENGTTTLPTPDRLGYTFVGFSKTKDGDIDYPNFIDNVEDINNVTIYAKWQTNHYSISYNLNGGTINNPKDDYTVEDSFTLPTPVKDSYVFIGWTGSNGTTPEKNVKIPKGTSGDLSYTANWSATDYNITYFLNGGSISGQRTRYNIETETFTLPKPTRYGYNFSGWTGSNGNNMQGSVTINKGTTGDRSYTAHWHKYNATDAGGIYLTSLRNGVWWQYNLDGYYNPGDNKVAGNWNVVVDNYCVYITGTKKPVNPYSYSFTVTARNDANNLLGTGTAYAPGDGVTPASTTICW